MDNTIYKQNLTPDQLQMVKTEMAKKKKNKGPLYLLWFFLGGLGIHRFYLGDTGYALGMMFTWGGFGIWWFIDLFLIGNRRDQINTDMERQLITEIKIMTENRAG
ncbi:TM2 domain-containing protein [Mechercharimyces sp. CAU 1602]|uniref:TM2 domain-containing protein n=1 Tax=Mechercharimyces sp. CAU 1602 TaxID=2973933 RepID=UPI002163560C|nr:TM2 domain-containing protein [Mechercharimyces sp. CAU 1602]MCS1351658.1 TM2 domain-containing protein [Mechercharimyces sp. CAU 1602]